MFFPRLALAYFSQLNKRQIKTVLVSIWSILCVRIHNWAESIHKMQKTSPCGIFIRVFDKLCIAKMPAVVTFIGQLIVC